MYSYSEALKIVASSIEGTAPSGDEYVIDEEHVSEFEWGWVFSWNSKRYVETRDGAFAVMGNGPIMFNRTSGEIRHAGSTYPIEHYIADYETELSNQKL